MFILAISHVLNVTQSKFYHICKGTLNHHTFVIYKQFEHFLFKLCTFWATWFLRAGMLKMFILAISHVLNVTQSKFYHICKGTLNHHTFVIYKLFEHFLIKLCTFWETWFLRAGKLKMFISAISHALNVTQSKFYHICKGTLNHHTFVIYKQFEHFLFKLCTFWATWFLRAGMLKMFILAISHVLNVTQSKFYHICKGTLNHHTFVIYKQFEHFLFKLCTFWATWFLRAGKLKMFILAISHVLNVTQSNFIT